MAEIDLDDRSIANFETRTPFIPRCAADIELRVTSFAPYETKTSSGWEAEVTIVSARATKENAHFEPLPEVGAKHIVRWSKVSSEAWKVDEALKQMRTFLAACNGQEHTPEFKAGEAKTKLIALSEAGGLAKVELRVLLRRDAWTKDGKTKEGKEVTFVNHKDEFVPPIAKAV